MAAYRKFIEASITSPDGLDLSDPEVKAANGLFERWSTQEEAKANGNHAAEQRANFKITMFYIDAGFTDPNYLSDVLSWLIQDAQDIEKDADNAEKISLRHDIAEAIAKIRRAMKDSAQK